MSGAPKKHGSVSGGGGQVPFWEKLIFCAGTCPAAEGSPSEGRMN